MTASLSRLLLIGACASALAGCGGGGQRLADTLGLSRQAPDEFQVVQRAPLVIPPDFNLRPPRPGEPGPLEPTAREAGRAALIGNQATSPSAEASPGQQALLQGARAHEADPEIRARIAADAGLAVIDERMFAFILPWQRRHMEQEIGEALDPRAEAERLRRVPLEQPEEDS